MTAIDEMLRVARDVQPDLWARTESVARIIDPAAFMDDWVIHPEDRAVAFAAKLKLQQATAMSKAQEVLKYLGVNAETDWYEILKRLAERPHPEEPKA